MPTITFISSKGATQKVQGAANETILKIALDNNVPMEHACGGNGFCNTCLCEITEGQDHLTPRNEQEETMGITEGSQRLGCQAHVLGDVTVKLIES
jgi:adenylate cyclase